MCASVLGTRSEASVKVLFESLEEWTSYLSAIGAQPRMVSWFRLITSIKFCCQASLSTSKAFLSHLASCIALAANLSTPCLRHEMMLYMKVTDEHWIALLTLASLKLNETHRKYAHSLAIALSSANIDFENVGRRSWSQLWRGERSSGGKGSSHSLLEVALAINGFRADSLREHDSSYGDNEQPCEVF